MLTWAVRRALVVHLLATYVVLTSAAATMRGPESMTP
jgi:hypothetical protein